MSDTHAIDSNKTFYEAKKGLFSWIFTLDHKRIALLYLYAIGLFFLVGVALGFVMRLELFQSGGQYIDPRTYNQIFTFHGVIMIFLVIIPSIPAVFGNFFLPIMIGTDDVALPRLNLFSWWLYIFGAILALGTLMFGNGPADTGWTFYAPYSVTSDTNVTMLLIAAFILGFSSILTGLNFIVTIHRLRAPQMPWMKMPLFAWGLYATAWIQLLATPIVGITLLMVVMERTFGIGLFDPALGGDPVLYQHLFWIYSHPVVYVMILPAMGIVSEVLPTAAQRTIFGYKAIAFSSMAIAFLGYFVWGHHMFTSGMSGEARVVFSFITFLVAIPTAIKVFNWISTLYKGSIRITPNLLWSTAFIFNFLIGGLTGLINGALAADVHVHDTTYIVAHFHYTMFGGTIFVFMGGLHYWFPKIWGKMYNEKLAYWALGLTFVGFNVLYGAMLTVGVKGMPRRYYDYLPQFESLNQVATVGSWVMIIGLLLMIYNLVHSARKGEKAPRNPWNGVTLEWQVPSPPPLHNFDRPFILSDKGPYDFSKLEEINNYEENNNA
jgi:cytochrome c oxidase subunit 1